MTEILYKNSSESEYSWACNVLDQKAQEYVETMNEKHDHGTWKVKP